MATKRKTFGDMSQADQDRCWEGDPTEDPPTAEKDAQSQQLAWAWMKSQKMTPEKAYPNDPTKREAFRAFLER